MARCIILLWSVYLNEHLLSFQELGTVMSQLGSAPPWAVLQNMIDKADSDRNGKVIQIYRYIYENLIKYASSY